MTNCLDLSLNILHLFKTLFLFSVCLYTVVITYRGSVSFGVWIGVGFSV